MFHALRSFIIMADTRSTCRISAVDYPQPKRCICRHLPVYTRAAHASVRKSLPGTRLHREAGAHPGAVGSALQIADKLGGPESIDDDSCAHIACTDVQLLSREPTSTFHTPLRLLYMLTAILRIPQPHQLTLPAENAFPAMPTGRVLIPHSSVLGDIPLSPPPPPPYHACSPNPKPHLPRIRHVRSNFLVSSIPFIQ